MDRPRIRKTRGWIRHHNYNSTCGGSQIRAAGSKIGGVGSQIKGAGSQIRGAGSQNRGAGSQNRGAGSQNRGAGSETRLNLTTEFRVSAFENIPKAEMAPSHIGQPIIAQHYHLLVSRNTLYI